MIYLVIPSVPPSVNNAYSTIRGTNKRVLTKEGKSYKVLTTTHLVRNFPQEMRFFIADAPYLIVARLWLETVYNKGWPAKATTRFRKMDLTNRIKLLEDALKDATGMDDSQNMTVILQKMEAIEGKEQTELWIWNLDREETPFDGVLTSL